MSSGMNPSCIPGPRIRNMRRWHARLALTVPAVVIILLSFSANAESSRPRIAIIIDDLGYERVSGERAIDLPGPLAFAVLPGTPRASYLAKRAHSTGKEVLLHLPLQAEKRLDPAEPGSLLLDMSRSQFVAALQENIHAVPHISGINTHRGSLLTRHPGHMDWLMEEILDRGDLYFIDSYTTAESVALQVAREHGVPSVRRDVFLDHDPSPLTLKHEFARLKKIARSQGFAVGIGHPYPSTLEFLESALPLLDAEGFELTGIGELIAAEDQQSRGTDVTAGE